MRVVILGAQGQLGAAVASEFSVAHQVTALGHAALDITNDAAVSEAIARLQPDVLVNCAGYNDVDGAEEHPVDALNVNAFGPRALARAAVKTGATFVQYSSDFVFDGRTDRPYVESDLPNPQSVYSASKLLGEWFAADAPSHYVLRVESLFSDVNDDTSRGSAGAIFRRLLAGEEAPVFVDRVVSPTYVRDAAAATRSIVERRLKPGLYHCVNSGHCTWYEFAEEAARLLGRDARLKPVTLEQARLRASRPKYSALANDALRELGVTFPDWRDALRRCLVGVAAR